MRCTTIYRPGQVVSSAAIRRETLIPVSQWLATLHVVFPVFLVFLVFLEFPEYEQWHWYSLSSSYSSYSLPPNGNLFSPHQYPLTCTKRPTIS